METIFRQGTCFALLVTIVASKEPDHRGTRFVIGFMENNSTLKPKILVIPQLETEVNVTVTMPQNKTFPTRSVTVRQNEVTTIELPVWVRMPVATVGIKGIQVEATSDIVVYGVNRANGSSDAFLALPADDALGQDYILASYKETGDFISQAGIIATEPNTTIFIHIPDAIDYNGEIRVGPTAISEERFYNVTLDAFQTLQLESFFDLTGINITSDKPITVISGNTARANATDKDFLCDHFSEQLSPTRSWGRSFATVPFSVGKTDDVFQVIAKHNDTEVNITKRFSKVSYHLNESQHKEVNVEKGDYISIEADKPVLVLQYVVPNVIQGGGGGEDCHHNSCGSFMLMVPPMEQQEHQYLFSTLNVTWKQNVNLVISSNLTEGVLLDGEAILNYGNVTDYKELPSWTVIDTHSEINYSAIQFSVDGGLHNLSHHYPDAVFAATSSDGHALGMLQKILYEVHVEYNINNNGTYQLSSDDGDSDEDYVKKKNQHRPRDEGLSHSVIAVIVSLCSGIFFVIVCIVGFIIAEFFCNGKEPSIFTRAKITPFNN